MKHLAPSAASLAPTANPRRHSQGRARFAVAVALALFAAADPLSALGAEDEAGPADAAGPANENPPDSTIAFQGGASIRFATLSQAAEILRRRDLFSGALSRFDRQARLKTNQEATEDDVLQFAAQQASDWPAEDIESVTAALGRLQPRFDRLAPVLPPVVTLIQTTGLEEGGAAYCRGAAVVLPHRHIRRAAGDLERLLAHELFHVISNQNADLRARLYSVIGFQVCRPITLPQSLTNRKLTNPDAPLVDCVITLEHEGRQRHAAPLLYASAENYDAAAGGTIFKYLTFRLLEVEPGNAPDSFRPIERDGEPALLDPRQCPDFHRQIGRNTSYIIHPDEILADNFAHLVLGTENLPSPEIVAAMQKILSR